MFKPVYNRNGTEQTQFYKISRVIFYNVEILSDIILFNKSSRPDKAYKLEILKTDIVFVHFSWKFYPAIA